jgi:tRNA synthetases class II (D, K and N)
MRWPDGQAALTLAPDAAVLRVVPQGMGLAPSAISWYADLRRYGTMKHAGFGLGFERLILFITGLENIRGERECSRCSTTAIVHQTLSCSAGGKVSSCLSVSVLPCHHLTAGIKTRCHVSCCCGRTSVTGAIFSTLASVTRCLCTLARHCHIAEVIPFPRYPGHCDF